MMEVEVVGERLNWLSEEMMKKMKRLELQEDMCLMIWRSLMIESKGVKMNQE